MNQALITSQCPWKAAPLGRESAWLEPESPRENPNNANRAFCRLTAVYLKPIVLIAIHSGMRRSEIVGLELRNLDLKERRIVLDKTKHSDSCGIHMNDTLLEVFKSLPVRLRSERVFPEINANMATVAFERACKRAGIPDFRFHDLRELKQRFLLWC